MNTVFIAQSIDGYIADKEGKLDWLDSIPNPDNIDMGFIAFTDRIDAIVMGRKTYETIIGFNVSWPYSKPVFVLSNKLKHPEDDLKDKVRIISGSPEDITNTLNNMGYNNLYIDGGSTIQQFLKKDLIDELIITTIPILLGGGVALFKDLPQRLNFKTISSKVFLNALVQTSYKRV